MNRRFMKATKREKGSYKNGKIELQSSVVDHEGITELRGKATTCFGYIHHPALRILETNQIIIDYTCDCYEISDIQTPCSHCLSLLAEYCGNTNFQVVNHPEGKLKLTSTPNAQLQQACKTIRILEDTTSDDGLRTITGKAITNFNYIHTPYVVMKDKDVVEYDCDCYLANGSQMCPHCSDLLHIVTTSNNPSDKTTPDPVIPTFPETTLADDSSSENYSEQEPVPSINPEDTEYDESDCMRIRFGTNIENNKAVFWFPNDTSLVTHPNTGIIGTMGTGKTQFTKSLITQLYRQKKHNCGKSENIGILIFDYKGDYNEAKTDFVRATNAKILKLHKIPFNPFALSDFKRKPQLHIHTAMAFADTLESIYNLGPIQKSVLIKSILSSYEKCGIDSNPNTWNNKPPTFEDVYQSYLQFAKTQRNDSLAAAMETIHIFDLFESKTDQTTSLYRFLEGVVVIDMSGYPTEIKNLIVSITLELFYAQMLNSSHSKIITTSDGKVYRQLKKMILVDEADNIMSQGFPALRSILKEGREYGVGMVLSTQFLDHFRADEEDYRKYIKTWVVHNVENLKKTEVEFVFQSNNQTDQLFHEIKHLNKHHSIARIGSQPPVHIQDLPFFEMHTDTQEQYLSDSGDESP